MVKRTPFETSFGIVSKVAREIRSHERFFLGEGTQSIETDSDHVAARAWTCDGARLLAIVNITDKPQTATVEGVKYTLKPLEVVLRR